MDYNSVDTRPFLWHQMLPIRGFAFAKAGDKLIVAGAPDVMDPKDPHASFEGRAGGLLSLHSARDGAKLAELRLASPPVFNGIAVTPGRIWLTCVDGKVRCVQAE